MSDPAYAKRVNDAVSEIAQSRGPIEQVKGMLMLAYRIDEERAFGLLKWRSQETNVKLRALAVQLAADFLDLDYDDNLPRRSSLDRLLMTAHLRVASNSEVASYATNAAVAPPHTIPTLARLTATSSPFRVVLLY